MVQYLFSNIAATSVAASQTAVAQGTQQNWTVGSSSAFPPASTTNVTAFVVADTSTSASSELIQVTNVSGTTWTVIRGAEGTTPVAHTGPFTVALVLSTAGLMNFRAAFTVPPATGNATTDSANIRNAIAAAHAVSTNTSLGQGGNVYLTGGNYQLDTNQLVISGGVVLTLSCNTVLTVNCTAGTSVDAITIGPQSGIYGESSQGAQAVIQNGGAFHARTLVSNANHSIQEYAFIGGIGFNVNSTSGGFGVAVVEFNGVFVNSGIWRTNIWCNNSNGSGIPGLLITGSPSSGFGPVFCKNMWIVNSQGPDMVITENNPSAGSCLFWGEDLDLEHPANPYSNLVITGYGGLSSVIINRLHTENNNASTSTVAGVKIDGATNVEISGYDALTSTNTNKVCIWVTSNAINARHKVSAISNINGMSPVIKDDVAATNVATGGIDIGVWYGPSATYTQWGTLTINDIALPGTAIPSDTAANAAIDGNLIEVETLADSVEIPAPANPHPGQWLIYRFVQDNVGGRIVTWDPVFRVEANAVSTSAGAVSVVSVRYDNALSAWIQLWATTGV